MSKKHLLSLFGEILEEDIPLMSRWMLEQRMNVRHLIPSMLSYAVDNTDRKLFQFILKRSTPADIRDWIRDSRSGKVTSTFKDLINEYLYDTAPNTLQFWYHKYSGDVFREIFDVTHPHPDKWQLLWFQKSVYGERAPEDSLIHKLREARKASQQTKDELEEFLKARVAWHYLSQNYPIEEYLESYLRFGPLRFVIERVYLYKDYPKLIEIALNRLGLPQCWKCGQVQLFVNPDANYKCIGCGHEFSVESVTYGPRINVSDILMAVDKHLSPTNTEHQRALRLALLDIAERTLARTILDEEHIGHTAILIDKSGSMTSSIELGISLGGLIGARLGKDQVIITLFDVGSYTMDVPMDIQQMLYLRRKIRADGGTNILPAMASIRTQMPAQGYTTLFIISDGYIFDNHEDVAEALRYLNPKRVIFVKLGSGGDDALSKILDGFKEKSLKVEPESPQDAETVLGIASYFKNRRLIASLQGIREDILNWAEANWEERKTVEYVKARKCGNCYAPVPPDIDFCLSCGASFT